MERTTDDACITGLLQQALAQETGTLSEVERANLTKLCEDVAQMVSGLRNSGDKPEAGMEGLDAEILELYQQVRAADESVRKLRREVPGELFASMQQDLRSFRPAGAQLQRPTPSTDTTTEPAKEGAAADPQQEERAPATGSSVPEAAAETADEAVPPPECWAQLGDVTNKVPSLMAKLDNTLQRLSRIISITEADHCRPSPRTVERALLGHGRRGMSVEEEEQDLGAENTRQRLAYDLAA